MGPGGSHLYVVGFLEDVDRTPCIVVADPLHLTPALALKAHASKLNMRSCFLPRAKPNGHDLEFFFSFIP